MNIFEGLLWAVGIIVGLGLICLVGYWVIKPLIDEDEILGNNNPNTPFRSDLPNSTKAILNSIKRGCIVFIIMIALILDSCDGKFLT